jgi:RNA polymerase sigma-70 factor (ECF subfamily)
MGALYVNREPMPVRVSSLKPVEEQVALPSSDDHARLLQAVAADQDRQAYVALFSYFGPRVKGFLCKSGLSDQAAEEVTQDTMLALWRKARFFDSRRGTVSSWIFAIARNQRVDRFRKERIQPPNRDVDPSYIPDAPPTGEEVALTKERAYRLRAALSSLSKEQLDVLRLSFFSERPHAEISRELGIPLGTVKSRARLALRKLNTLLDGEK